MPKRRADGRYQRSFRLPDGTRKSVYGKTRQEVDKKLADAKRQAEMGQLVKASHQRFGDYLDYWLSIKKLTIREGTTSQYASRIRCHIAPALGKIPLQRLSQAHIQRFISNLVEEGLAPGTIRLQYQIVHTALKDAVKRRLIPFNPCQDIMLPREEDTEDRVLDEESAHMLLQIAQGTPLEAFIALALATGLRRGELLALKWGDIDWERGILRVQRNLSYINGKGFVEGQPKTKSSKRSILLAGFALDALKAHRTRQIKQQLAAPVWEKRDLIFCNKRGGYIVFSTLRRDFKALLVQAALSDMRIHDLRHSMATLLLKMRVPAKVVQELLGHASIKTTMDQYGHVIEGMQGEAIDDLDALLSSQRRHIDAK